MKLISVLESRNRCLRKISEFSENFLNEINIDAPLKLDSFEIWRNTAFKTLQLFDNYINILAAKTPLEEKNEDFKRAVRNILEISKNLIYYIQDIDMKISEKIKDEKHILLKTLVATEQSQKTVAKFRSATPEKSGGQLDGKI